jgi:hypothetical protein
MNEISAFEMGVKGMQLSEGESATVVNARTVGQAKMEYLRHLDGCFPNVKFTQITCRKVGGPVTSKHFIRNAEYRGLPQVRCGDAVKVGEARGVIVGHNSSANFDVLFDDDSPRYAGLRLNVHPSEVETIAQNPGTKTAPAKPDANQHP